MKRLALAIATCGYVGYIPHAPGTFGSAAAVVIFYLVRASESAAVEIGVVLAVLGLGLWSGTVAEEHFGGIDPRPVVIDEVAGMLMTLLLLPVNTTGVLAAFVVFRALDVFKPWPAARLEHLPGGLGVMADDAMVAVYGNVVMRVAMAMLPGWFA
jgi:phosphatidylglycerophosphatase A